MPPIPQDSNQLLTKLEAAKNRFEARVPHPSRFLRRVGESAANIAKLLTQLSKLQLNVTHQLIRFHQCLLFLRAFPHAPSSISRIENHLNTYHPRTENLRAASADMSVFDDFDTSGIAATTMQ